MISFEDRFGLGWEECGGTICPIAHGHTVAICLGLGSLLSDFHQIHWFYQLKSLEPMSPRPQALSKIYLSLPIKATQTWRWGIGVHVCIARSSWPLFSHWLLPPCTVPVFFRTGQLGRWHACSKNDTWSFLNEPCHVHRVHWPTTVPTTEGRKHLAGPHQEESPLCCPWSGADSLGSVCSAPSDLMFAVLANVLPAGGTKILAEKATLGSYCDVWVGWRKVGPLQQGL